MNPLLPYEQTVAAKLEELSPNLLGADMADAIWADIEAQLDGDLPIDDNNTPTNPEPSGGGSWAMGTKLAIGVAGLALVAYWLIQLQQPVATPSIAPTTATEKKGLLDDTAQQASPTIPLPKLNQPPPNTSNPITNNLPLNQSDQSKLLPVISDSPYLQPVAAPIIQKDSTAVVAPAATPNLVLPPPGKKKKGTQGIKDSDYKFVTGKDST